MPLRGGLSTLQSGLSKVAYPVVKSRPQGRCYQTPKLEYAWINLAGEPIITYAHEKVAVTQIPRALPPEKKPFHERFWWLPAAIGLIAIAASGAGVLIAALA